MSHKFTMKSETVVQVHKPIEKHEDQNENYSREISVDEESQINSKILSLIESEMKRSTKSHFTDSRPQSLSFYEDEKVPEELSGNLELLSPEERKHYKKRREMDTEEMNAYNVIQDLYTQDEIINKKKSRKKRHDIGDSTEMMIPKEKKKSKKKKREGSPGKRKHKKRDEDGEPKNDVTTALEELQDDVFENDQDFNAKTEKVRKSQKKSDKIYVQKKNKFEAVNRTNNLNRQSAYDLGDDSSIKKYQKHPLELAISFQKYWIRLTTLCHGLLGGLAFGHFLYLLSNLYDQNDEFLSHYSHYSATYVSFFYFLCVVCLISVFEKLDIAHFEKKLQNFHKTSIVLLLYLICLIVHLSAAQVDYKLGLVHFDNETISINVTQSELMKWNHLSIWRSILALGAWIIVGLSSEENLFYDNLRSMETYLPGGK